MKKKVIFYFFKFSVLFFSVFLSCNEGYLGQDIQMEKLNDVGKAFMTHLLSNPDGKQQWEKLIRKGDISKIGGQHTLLQTELCASRK